MKDLHFPITYKTILLGLLVLGGLYLASLYSYLLFHTLTEMFSIVVAWGIFVIAWNSREFHQNSYLLFIGIASLFVGVLDLAHTLAYEGMGVFVGYDANLPTQLWIATRYTQSLSLLIAPLVLGRKLKTSWVFSGYLAVTVLALGSIFVGPLFPACYIAGQGLTPFKKISEYVISLIFAASVVLLYRKRRAFDRSIFWLLAASAGFGVVSELFFTLYVDVYGLFNLAGHLFEIVSFYLVYKAFIETGLVKPYALLFRELKQSEQAAQRERDFAESLIETAQAIVMVLDNRGRIVRFNPYMQEISGYSLEEVRGRDWFTAFLPPRDQGRIRELFAQSIADVRVRGNVNPIVTRDGQEREIEWFDASLKDAAGQITGLLYIGQDITERRRAEEALRQYAAELEARNEELDAYAHTVAHDLKGPLALMIGYAEVLAGWQETFTTAELQEYVQRIASSGRKMSTIIDELLLLAGVRKADVRLQKLDMAAIVSEALSRWTQLIAEQRAEIVVPQAWPVALGHAPWVEEVWANYISNALKYGGRPPHVELGAAKQENGTLHFWVRDNGPGIEPEVQARLFVPFTRAAQAQIKGHGLGLSIVRRIVEKLGGEVGVESEIGRGSTFSFTLRAASNHQLIDVRTGGHHAQGTSPQEPQLSPLPSEHPCGSGDAA